MKRKTIGILMLTAAAVIITTAITLAFGWSMTLFVWSTLCLGALIFCGTYLLAGS